MIIAAEKARRRMNKEAVKRCLTLSRLSRRPFLIQVWIRYRAGRQCTPQQPWWQTLRNAIWLSWVGVYDGPPESPSIKWFDVDIDEEPLAIDINSLPIWKWL
jgi:hypothetical protein